MPLAPGTALQNGHYVIDALLEAAPNGDLYWGTHVVVGLPVFIQVFPIGNLSHDDLTTLIARLEGIAFSPQSPLPNPFQLFHGDDQTLCLAMSTSVGLPWSTVRQKQPPLSTRQALANIRQLADHLAWLKSQGLRGLDLSLNRVWLSQESATVTLTGLPHAYLHNFATSDTTPDTSVQALAQLLFSFLTGQILTLPTTADSPTPKEQLKALCPNVSPIIATAIEQALASPEPDASPMGVSQWLQQLPDAGTLVPVTAPSQSLPSSSTSPKKAMPEAKPSTPAKQGSWLLPSLAATAVLAALAGGGLGAHWRLNTQSMPGAIKLDPKQSFPAQANWSGDAPEADFNTPYVPRNSAPSRRDRWYESPAPTRNSTFSNEPINSSVVDTSDGFDVPSGLNGVNSSSPASTTPLNEPREASTNRPTFTNDRSTESLETPPAEPAGLEALEVPEAVDVPEASPLEAPIPIETAPSPSSMAIPKATPAPEAATES